MDLRIMAENHKRKPITYNIRLVLTWVIILLNSGYALTVGNNRLLIVITALYLAADFFLFENRKKIGLNSFLFYCLLIFSMLISCIVNLDFTSLGEYIRLILLATTAYRVYMSYNVNDFLSSFCRLMRMAVVCSLVLFTLISVFPSFPVLYITNSYGVPYYTCIFTSVIDAAGAGFMRNSGLFWEPGMFAAFIMMWSIIELVGDAPKKYIWLMVAFLTLLTTKSTSGYMYMVLLLILAFALKIKRKSPMQILILILMFSVAVYLFASFDSIVEELARLNPAVFKKFIENNASVTDRLNNPLADLYVTLSNPKPSVGLLGWQSTFLPVRKNSFECDT